MFMPDDLSKLIHDFAKPLTHPYWRYGGSFPSYLFYRGLFQDVHPLLNQIEFEWFVNHANEFLTAEEFEFYLDQFDLY